jgi:hypothetical protein
MKGRPFLFLGVAAYWDIGNALLHVNTHFVARAQVLPVARFVPFVLCSRGSVGTRVHASRISCRIGFTNRQAVTQHVMVRMDG